MEQRKKRILCILNRGNTKMNTDQKLRKRFPELIGTQHKMQQMIQETQQDAESSLMVECFL